MERKRLNAGRIRAVGYDSRARVLELEFSDGSVYQYTGVSDEVHRRLVSSSAAASYFRDNIEEEYPAKRVR
ncbi:MAG TPA: KTSC domain-containing protein [Burkholderiales bacterium]|nr:KTSC domain-containing protein [Burkholderiales bacterium]